MFVPATGTGLFAILVLNINNLRDIENDKASGKHTLVTRIGAKNGRYYHLFLLFGALCCYALSALFIEKTWSGWLFIFTLPLCIKHARTMMKTTRGEQVRPLLGEAVKCALLSNLLFAVGLLLS